MRACAQTRQTGNRSLRGACARTTSARGRARKAHDPPQPRPHVRIALVLAAGLLLAGCLGGPAPPPAGPAPPQGAAPLHLDVPVPDLARASAWHHSFVQTYTNRVVASPTNWMAGQFLASELRNAGWEVTVYEYGPTGVALPVQPGAGINAIVGVKRGADDAVVGWTAHYDCVPQTIQCAYDNGSGTATAMELARMFGATTPHHTLVAAFFDAEEEGTIASGYFVQQVVGSDKARWHLIVGLDMVGANWPGYEWPEFTFIGEQHVDTLKPVEDRLYRDVLRFPEEGVVVVDKHDRSSDENTFKNAGVPILRMAGGRNAGDYAQYHQPGDTVDYLLQMVGGEEHWQQGMGTVLNATAWNVALFDRLPHPEDPGFAAAAGALLDQLAAREGTTAAGP